MQNSLRCVPSCSSKVPSTWQIFGSGAVGTWAWFKLLESGAHKLLENLLPRTWPNTMLRLLHVLRFKSHASKMVSLHLSLPIVHLSTWKQTDFSNSPLIRSFIIQSTLILEVKSVESPGAWSSPNFSNTPSKSVHDKFPGLKKRAVFSVIGWDVGSSDQPSSGPPLTWTHMMRFDMWNCMFPENFNKNGMDGIDTWFMTVLLLSLHDGMTVAQLNCYQLVFLNCISMPNNDKVTLVTGTKYNHIITSN